MVRRDSGYFEVDYTKNEELDFFVLSLENILKSIPHENQKIPSYHIRTNFYTIKKNSCSFEITSDKKKFTNFNKRFEKFRKSENGKLSLEHYLRPVPFEKRIVPYFGRKSIFTPIQKQNSCSFFIDFNLISS
ncbi:10414_t:CDS:1 [Diversispora eburnea]|uniref:10414_t:CDS:1 n=1 Tax=Diversispora eburnea TaxID=1213867 RepID=A0A9N8V0L0_9GLOM|nr:10414_t:CDS:1 [Diversispora eburnea]